MMKLLLTSLMFVSVVSVAAVANADTSVVPSTAPSTTTPTAPQNEDWNNVSHINGQVVPVGERGAYLYKSKETNISVDPIGLLLGYYDGSVSHAMTQNVALSASVTYFSSDGDSALSGALSAPIYFRRTFSGPFLEPGLVFQTSNSTATSYDYDGGYSSSPTSDSFVAAEMLVGWQWMFDSGLNLSMASGATRRLTGDMSNSYSGEQVGFAGYFRAGYAF